MRFIALVMLGDLGTGASQGTLQIFMCGNNPGMCDDWDATSGGNQALILAADDRLVPAAVPTDPAAMLDEVSAVQYVTTDAAYDDARAAWAEREGRPAGDVLGQLGGQPTWIQADETPDCADCGKPMGLVVQLEEGHDHRTAANFGGRGCGYGFGCQPCGTAAFLWQCLDSRTASDAAVSTAERQVRDDRYHPRLALPPRTRTTTHGRSRPRGPGVRQGPLRHPDRPGPTWKDSFSWSRL
jgi:hypothetical protein